ncbi:30S ribosomal protein S8 [Chloroflexota bacterium]
MTVTDPIGDMLTRMRNAIIVRHDSVLVPSSKLKMAIAKILREEGFIKDYEVVKGKSQRVIKIYLKYDDKNQPILTGVERISKPGMRVYSQNSEITRVYGGMGISILSTPKGIMTGQSARRQGMGGEILCNVW